MDTVENLTQIGQWTLGCYQKERNRIDLYLSLTRKNLNALLGFPLSPAFGRNFQKFSLSFSKLEEEYRTGKVDRTVWANRILECGNDLTRYSESV
jgi:hypothetical protein